MSRRDDDTGGCPGVAERVNKNLDDHRVRLRSDGPAPTAISPAAAEVLAEIVRAYVAAHGLGNVRDDGLGESRDEYDTVGVRGVHPDEHRRPAVA